MDCKDKIRELRESTGMNRKEFCQYFQIPYRTVTEWELGGRHAPEYVLRLLEYYIHAEKLEQKVETAQDKDNGEGTSWLQNQ
jgi:DNA-binding transcriptional regulator YiaG